MNKKIVNVAAMCLGLTLLTTTVSAQTSDDDLQLFRKDVRSLKKQIIAANIELSDAEAQQFWPIYDRCTAEMAKIVDKKFALLEQYAQNYNTLTDDEADAYIQGRAAVRRYFAVAPEIPADLS